MLFPCGGELSFRGGLLLSCELGAALSVALLDQVLIAKIKHLSFLSSCHAFRCMGKGRHCRPSADTSVKALNSNYFGIDPGRCERVIGQGFECFRFGVVECNRDQRHQHRGAFVPVLAHDR